MAEFQQSKFPVVKKNKDFDEEQEKCWEIFSLVASDDQKIELKDIGLVIRACGLNPTQQEINDWTTLFERDGRTRLEFVDVITVFQRMKNGPTDHVDTEKMVEEIVQSLHFFDKDRRGYIKCEELRHVLMTLGEAMSPTEVDDLLGEFGVKGSVMVQYEHFVSRLFLS